MQNKIIQDRTALFCECFGDDMSVARELFSITDIHSIRITEGTELAAMATLVPVSIGEELCGFYAYGVCVREDLRGKGLFRKIMKLCEEYAASEGASLLCLIPATDALAKTYRGFGYTLPISLAHNKKEGDMLISSRSRGFFEFCNSDAGELMSAGFGLAIPLDGKLSGIPLAFDAFFGER